MNDHELFRAGCWHELTYKDGTSDKWWSIKIHKTSHHRKWGAAGNTGREKITSFLTAEQARHDAERLYNMQIKQGYGVKKPYLLRTTELVHIVDYGNWEKFVTSVYQTPFEFVSDQECSNDSSHRFRPNGEMCDYDKQDIEDWIKSEGMSGSYMTHRLLDDCVRQRLIPAGIYLIEVCW